MALAKLPAELAEGDEVQVDVLGELVPAVVAADVLYDPGNDAPALARTAKDEVAREQPGVQRPVPAADEVEPDVVERPTGARRIATGEYMCRCVGSRSGGCPHRNLRRSWKR